MKNTKKEIQQLENLEIKKEAQEQVKGGGRLNYNPVWNCW